MAVESTFPGSQRRRAPDGTDYLSLPGEALASTAESLGVGLRRAEALALERGIVPERYHRNIGTIGMDGQRALLESQLSIVGAGGIGGTALEICLRLGFGRIVIFDADRFSESNLNRQILATVDWMGLPKVEAAVRRAAVVNPSVEVVAHAEAATEENLPAAIRGSAAVIDALDSVAARFAVERACAAAGVPLVHGAVAGLRGQVSTIYPGDWSLARIYGPVPDGLAGAEVSSGAPAIAPFMVASWQALEALRIVLGSGAALRGKLLLIDAMDVSVRTVDLRPA